MEKDFLIWHELKLSINEKETALLFQEQEIWWCSLGKNIGVEENGKNEKFVRPVVILKKFSKDMFWGLPMTSKDKIGKYYYNFFFNGGQHTVLISQLRVLSGKRLLRKIGKINNKQFDEIKMAVIQIIK
jgi:mRNA interferase MazF